MHRHAYLILAHNQWDLLEQLLVVLDDERNDIYLHIDKKAVNVPESRLQNKVVKSNLYFVKRRNIVWGGTQMVSCTLSMLEQAGESYSYYHLISGVDFPIKSQDYIHSFFDNNLGKQFVDFDWNAIKSGICINRMKYYHFFINIIGKGDNPSAFYRVLGKMECALLTLQSKLKVNRISYDMYKGSQWFSISNNCVSAILSHKKEIIKRYRFGAITDEIWLQTFLMEYFSDKIATSNMRYIKWIQGNCSPETLTIDDYDSLINSSKLFARKFDWNKDNEVIKKLKTYLSVK